MRLPARLLVPIVVASAALCMLPALADEDAAEHVTVRAQELLDQLVPHVERAAELEFTEGPRVEVVTADRAAEWFRKDLSPQIETRYADASEAQRRTLLTLASSSSVASCLARYSWSAKRILIVRQSFDRQRASAGFALDEARDLLRAVLAHEAIHALDDQHFDLGAAFTERGNGPEALRAVSMVVEGRAVHLGRAAAKRARVSERARGLLPGGERPADASAWTLRLTYEAGAAFVAAVDADRDAQAFDSVAALMSPPRTTHEVFHPTRWRGRRIAPRGGAGPDPRPAARIRAAGISDSPTTVSELQLRARYAALHGPEKAATLFAGFHGAAQVLADGTNVAVLAFADADSAQAYVDIAGEEAPTEREGDLVLRAFGPAADALIARLRAASDREGE